MNRTDQMRNAARQYDNAAPDEDDTADRIADLASEYSRDPGKVEEAHQRIEGTFDDKWYGEVQRALSNLRELHPIIAGDEPRALASLYSLARVVEDALDAALVEMAEEQVRADGDE